MHNKSIIALIVAKKLIPLKKNMIMSSSEKYEFQRKKIRVPAEEYVIYYPPTDQSDARITLNCSIIANTMIVLIMDSVMHHFHLKHFTSFSHDAKF